MCSEWIEVQILTNVSRLDIAYCFYARAAAHFTRFQADFPLSAFELLLSALRCTGCRDGAVPAGGGHAAECGCTGVQPCVLACRFAPFLRREACLSPALLHTAPPCATVSVAFGLRVKTCTVECENALYGCRPVGCACAVLPFSRHFRRPHCPFSSAPRTIPRQMPQSSCFHYRQRRMAARRMCLHVSGPTSAFYAWRLDVHMLHHGAPCFHSSPSRHRLDSVFSCPVHFVPMSLELWLSRI